MSVLAVGSHPDDIEFGCGGTLSKMAAKGHEVNLLVLTDGSKGGDTDMRYREQERAAKAIGAHEVFWGNFVDTRLHFYDNVIAVIEKVVAKVQPTFVFAHHGNDTHQDHRNVSQCAVVATRNIPNVLYYEGPTTIHFQPNVYIDIADYIDAKKRCLACHKSQVMRTNINEQSILNIAKAYAGFRGTECRVRFAEGFCSLRMFIVI